MQRQTVRFTVFDRRGQQDFVMMAVCRSIGLPIDVGQRFGVAEIAGLAERQEEHQRRIRLP